MCATTREGRRQASVRLERRCLASMPTWLYDAAAGSEGVIANLDVWLALRAVNSDTPSCGGAHTLRSC